MTIGRDCPEFHRLFIDRVQIDAVQIIARLLGRDRKLGLVDEALEIGRREREAVRQLAGGEIGEVGFGQALQREARSPGTDRERPAIVSRLQFDLGALGKLAHDVIDHVRGHGGGAGLLDLGRHGFHDFEIEIGCFQFEAVLAGADQDVGEDRNRIAFLTTRWTWESDLTSSERSTVTFMNSLFQMITRIPRIRRGLFERRYKTLASCFDFRKSADRKNPLFLQHTLQDFDLFGQHFIAGNKPLDLADRVQHGGVVTPSETASDFRQRAQRQGLGEIHGDLTWANDVRGAPGGKKIRPAHPVMFGDDPQNVLHPDAAGIGGPK